MPWYTVIKAIRRKNGTIDRYHYQQRSWREGKRVRTECICLGRVDATPPHLQLTMVAPPRNTTQEHLPPKQPDWRRPVKEALYTIRDRIETDRWAHELVGELLRDIDTVTLPSLITALATIAGDMMERYAQEGILDVLTQAKAALSTTLPAALPRHADAIGNTTTTTHDTDDDTGAIRILGTEMVK